MFLGFDVSKVVDLYERMGAVLYHIGIVFRAGDMPVPLSVAVVLIILSLLLLLPPSVLSRIIAYPYQLVTRMLRLAGVLHDQRTWSVVYDSVTKRPIDPAYITVRNKFGSIVATAITDLDGRFGVIVQPGTYTIAVEKTNYTFPSARLVGSATDGYYTALYFGTEIDIGSSERSLAFAIPMDPIGNDWNQTEKKRRHIGARDRKAFLFAAVLYFLIAGVLIVVDYLRFKELMTLQFLQLYSGMLVLGVLYVFFKPDVYYHSVVIQAATGRPLGFARIKVFNSNTYIQVATKTTSLNGQFVCLVPNGTYYVTIERRDDAGVYTLVHTSEAFRVIDRSVNRQFVV